MPWTAKDACGHDKDACSSAKKARQWMHIANASLKRGDSKKKAIMKASGVVDDIDLTRTPLVIECGDRNGYDPYSQGSSAWVAQQSKKKPRKKLAASVEVSLLDRIFEMSQDDKDYVERMRARRKEYFKKQPYQPGGKTPSLMGRIRGGARRVAGDWKKLTQARKFN